MLSTLLTRGRSTNMRQVALFIAMAWVGFAHAIQPVEAGLQPLLDRQKGMLHEQQQLNKLLQSATTEPKVRVDAYREYLMVELERQELECDIQRARSWASSPLVMYATPTTETTCGTDLAYRSSKSSLSTTEAKR